MQPSSGPRPAGAELKSTQPDRKRKRPSRQHSSEDPAKQQTLQSLFAGQQKPHVNGAGLSPNSKRLKPDSPQQPPSPRTALATRDMYTFSSRSPVQTSNGAIDLTGSSPPASPLAKKMNGAMKTRPGINAHTGAKKLVVKNLKQNTQWDSKAYLEKIWGQLDEALTIIFKDGHDGFSKEDLYRGVENVCRQGGASTLFSRLDKRCIEHVEADIRRPLCQITKTDNVTILESVLKEWSRWKEHMVLIRAIFFFLDRSYLLSSSKMMLAEYTPQRFRELVFNVQQLHDPVLEGACDLVAEDRMDTGFNQDLFKQAVDMFHELAVYTSFFEPRFLASTQDYIVKYADRIIIEKTIPEYVALADKAMHREMSRCDQFALDASTRREMLALLEQHLIDSKEADLVEYDALATMLDNNATSDIKALYTLLSRRRLGAKLRPAFEKWVDEAGTSIVFAQDADNMIIQLLSLKRRMDFTWQTCFQRDEALGHALRESFAIFMNKTKKSEATHGTDNTKVGEMIAKYVDQLLRGGAKAIPTVLTIRRASSITGPPPKDLFAGQPAEEDNEDADVDEDAEINIQLDQVLDLFRFVQGKAVFEAFYKKDLARRLLMGRSASADAERSMLTRLKTECGAGFTQNLEQMFKDVELAREEMQSYKQRLEDRIGYDKKANIDLSVNILSAAAWPTYPDIPVAVPQNVQKAIADFELHYKSKHSGRKLDWKHALAHCQMKAMFGKGSKELVVSSFQAVVLLLFNGRSYEDKLPYKHILEESGLRMCFHCYRQTSLR